MFVPAIELNLQTLGGHKRLSLQVGSVAGARFCSREVEATRAELDVQLKRDGRLTMATTSNPSVFKLGRYLLTQEREFEVQGSMTGGETEVVAIRDGNDIFITVGSDQCDRELDPLFPDKPKQMCPHPLAQDAWPYAEVSDHWDKLRVYSHVVVGDKHVALQDTAINELVTLDYLLAMKEIEDLQDPMVLYCGCSSFLDSVETEVKQLRLPSESSLGVGDAFLVRLHDPVLDRTIEHKFSAVPLGDDLAQRKTFD